MDPESNDPTELAMFPLGSVLFPAMPLPLRIFEQRYLTMLQDILPDEPAEFGVVLIERGHEVGGGDEQRYAIGTVARITELAADDGFVGVMAEGIRRVEVVEWLDGDSYPRAMVRDVPELEWDDAYEEQMTQAETLVRRTLARASEFDDQRWPSTVGLSDEAMAHLWQLAAITPVGSFDHVALLRAQTVPDLLDAIIRVTTEVAETYDALSD